MYSADNTKQLQQSTTSLLHQLKSSSINEEQIEELRNALRFHEYRYYIQNDPLISDFEYDQLYKTLEKIEAANPSLITSDSPTQRVAKGLGNDFKKVQHLVPMLSLENSYDADDLIDWDRKAKEASGLDHIEYCVEPKFDGASISLIYEDDKLVRAATRGDGTEGEEITTNVRQIRSIPLSADFSKFAIKQIEIRGEILMSKKNFKAYNDQLAEDNLPPLANPRNAASGSLRIKDAKEVARRNLEAFLYHVGYVAMVDRKQSTYDVLHTHSGALKMMWELGFRSPEKEKKICKGIQEVIDYCNEFEQKRDTLPYEIDGMVIKVNDLQLQDQMGMTSHHPRWAIAYKFKARQGTSKLRAVEYQVGRTGAVTPVAKIDPVAIGGVTVTSISLHNQDFIAEKDLMLGDTVLVERAGDVIPYIVKSMAELRTGKEEKIIFPTHCPVCNSVLVKPEEEAVWRCNNYQCEAQVVERIIHFNSKDAMDIRGMGDANVRKFYELGFLKDIPSLYRLPYDKIKALEGYGAKSVENLQTAIENSKKQPLFRLIYALGIRFVGEATAKTLANSTKHLLDIAGKTLEELQQLEDIGPRVAGSIHDFFSNQQNLQLLKELEELGLQLKNEQKESKHEGNLTGVTFLFTGTLPTLKRSAAEQMAEEHGGSILSGVSAKLNYLVVGEDAGSKLEKAKKISTIKIITEEEFLELLKN
ncbi:NAD-dependent DNA ligase LigA [Lacibacter sp.]|uniref:NAD-dependent DNA ligase LigA n=1 Tax=Lacibacter sp. TaxID=1915409 RepID=UPI002B4B3361|nr:NAD-dependent DNA ligase LigA [Lacibacter sp.]HLP36212.1 NAD-dependent DNA ligase LigA [Lacibacter sp.]